MTNRLSGKVAVVTGAASGLGEAIARRFVAEGARLVLADLQVEAGERVAASLGDAATFVACDVTDETLVAAAVDAAVDRWGRLDVMVNNAGIIGAVGPIADTDSAGWLKTIAVLQHSVFYGTKHAARVMVPQGGGVILNTTSVAGVIGGLGPHAYTTAKTAVIGFTRSVSAELAQHGVRCNAIAPGTIPTAMTAVAVGGTPGDLARVSEHARDTNPLGFAPDPADIANAALYLASDEARLVTGHTLVVDAGRSVNGQSSRFASSRPGLVDVADAIVAE